MTEYRSNRTGRRVIVGGLIVIIGLLLLLSNIGFLDFEFGRVIFSWQVILIVIGAIIYANSNDRAGLILMVVGGIFLISKYFYLNAWTLWPVFLILIGLFILFNVRRGPGHYKNDELKQSITADIKSRIEEDMNYINEDINDINGLKERLHNRHHHYHSRSGQEINEDFVDDIAIFSGSKKYLHTQNFRGGKITAIFGGSELDFADCKLAPGNNVIDILTLFGGTSMYVPRDWKIIFDITPMFGGLSDERRKDPNQVYGTEGTLVIRGTCIFGGIEIKSV